MSLRTVHKCIIQLLASFSVSVHAMQVSANENETTEHRFDLIYPPQIKECLNGKAAPERVCEFKTPIEGIAKAISTEQIDGTISVRTFFSNGKISQEWTEKNGERDGRFRTFHQNGRTYAEGNFSDGKLVKNLSLSSDLGDKLALYEFQSPQAPWSFSSFKCTYFHDNANKKLEMVVKDGKSAASQSFDYLGQLVTTVKYSNGQLSSKSGKLGTFRYQTRIKSDGTINYTFFDKSTILEQGEVSITDKWEFYSIVNDKKGKRVGLRMISSDGPETSSFRVSSGVLTTFQNTNGKCETMYKLELGRRGFDDKKERSSLMVCETKEKKYWTLQEPNETQTEWFSVKDDDTIKLVTKAKEEIKEYNWDSSEFIVPQAFSIWAKIATELQQKNSYDAIESKCKNLGFVNYCNKHISHH